MLLTFHKHSFFSKKNLTGQIKSGLHKIQTYCSSLLEHGITRSTWQMVHTDLSPSCYRFHNFSLDTWDKWTASISNEAKGIKTDQLQENKGGNLQKDLQGRWELLNVLIFRPISRKQTHKAYLLLCYLTVCFKEWTNYSGNDKFAVVIANEHSNFHQRTSRYFKMSQTEAVKWSKMR